MTSFAFHRVYGSTIDSKKRWFALSTTLCGCQPKIFASNKIFSYFPREIARVKALDVWRENGRRASSKVFEFGRENGDVYMATAFGISAGLLRQREFVGNGFVHSAAFNQIVEAVNCVELDTTTDANCNSAGYEDYTTPKTSRMQILRPPIYLPHGKAAPVLDTPPLTPATGRHPASSLTDIFTDSSLGRILKKRKMSLVCSNLLDSLRTISEHNSIRTIFGHGVIYGDREDKLYVSDELSKAFDIVASRVGAKESLRQLLGDSAMHRLAQSMRVPDWVQLFVKLRSKLPDNAWQTHLNFLNLGRSGVSSLSLVFLFSVRLYETKPDCSP